MDDASTLSRFSTVEEGLLPQLPGYRSNRTGPGIRKQTVKYINKQMFLTEADKPNMYLQHDLVQSNSATTLTIRSGKSQQPSMGSGTTGIPAPLKRPNVVLCFNAYFKEAVHDSYLENHRIRRCELYYYLEDDSMQIIEPKQENSGVPQGNFMKRHRVPKTEDEYFGLEDLAIGASLELYGRVFQIYGCNESTRAYLRDLRGIEPAPDDLPPVDQYETERSALMSRETGKDPTVSHNVQKNPMKVFAEAALGNTVDNSGRQGFLKYGTSVLRFYCYWDDSTSLYGDVQMFKIHYFLYDNTIEVLTVFSPNSGRDSYPLLLKRAKLPKPGGGFYHWTDFSIGGVINAYSREMLILDADVSTRAFYNREGQSLGSRIEPPVPERAPAPTRYAPPYAGFGSEEDSLTSCTGSLVQKAPTKVLGEEGVLRYQAAFADPRPEDEGRLFVVVYYCAEFAVMIREPPRRNSGIIGGTFLAKQKLKHADGRVVEASELFIGAKIDMHGHTFAILDADVATLKYMEARPDQFPLSDVDAVLGTLREMRPTEELLKQSQARSHLTFAEYEDVLAGFAAHLPKQARVTFWRAFSQDGYLPVEALLSL